MPALPLRVQLLREVHSGELWQTFWGLQDFATSHEHKFCPSMRQDTNGFIHRRYTCQIAKGRHTNVSLYTPSHIPMRPWTYITMDFIIVR